MQITLLTEKDVSNLDKLKEEFNIFRVIDIKGRDIEAVEFFNNDGAFRGFGRDTKEAFKKAKKVLKTFYSNRH